MAGSTLDFHFVLHLFLLPALHVDFLSSFIPSLVPGRLTEEPLGFSFLFLRPVNFHKTFNMRTSRLIYCASEPRLSATLPCFGIRVRGLSPSGEDACQSLLCADTRCDLAEQIVWTLSGFNNPCVRTKLYPSCEMKMKVSWVEVLPVKASGHIGNGKITPSGITHFI